MKTTSLIKSPSLTYDYDALIHQYQSISYVVINNIRCDKAREDFAPNLYSPKQSGHDGWRHFECCSCK